MRKFWQFFRDNPDVEEYILYGGSGGSKSHSTCQYLTELLFTVPDIVFLITRKTRPALKATTWRMILEGLAADGYQEGKDYSLNRADLEIHASNGNVMRFTGLDDPQKLKSSSYNYAYIEEVTEFSPDDVFFIENTLRRPRNDGLLNQLFMTFNPVAATHWVWKEKVLKRDPKRSALIHSTHWDNPFLPQSYRDKLESLIEKNQNLYNVYTLGIPGVLGNLIYQNWDEVRSDVYAAVPDTNLSYGLDFGYNNPLALLEIKIADEEVYARELIYETHLDDLEQVDRIKKAIPLQYRNRTIYCDSAYPGRIKALKAAGLKAVSSDKDVVDGINYVKTLRLHFDHNSVNLISEAGSYEYIKKGDEVQEEPVDFRNHCFVAGTMVQTDHGIKPIENILEGDLVLTRAGYKRVLWAGLTGIQPIWEISFSNGVSLFGTHDHPIYVEEKGFVPLDTIRYGDYVCSLKPLFSTELNSGDIQNQSGEQIGSISNVAAGISMKASDTCTKRYGNPYMVQFQKGVISTIKTATRSIMPLRTLIASLRLNTSPIIRGNTTQSITKRLASIWRQFNHSLKNGTLLIRERNGTANMASMPIRTENLSGELATCAEKNLTTSPVTAQQGSVPTNASRHTGVSQELITSIISVNSAAISSPQINTKTGSFALNPVVVKHIGKTGATLPVYDLTILDQPEFFANGILVHNSMDALRYNLYTRRPSSSKPYKPDQIKAALNPDVTALKFRFNQNGR